MDSFDFTSGEETKFPKEAKKNVSTLILLVFSLMAIWFTVEHFMAEVLGFKYYDLLFQIAIYVILLTFLGGVVLMINNSSYPIEFYGFTWKNGWKNAAIAVVASFPVMGLLTFVKWYFVNFFEIFAHIPVFVGLDFMRNHLAMIILYGMSTLAQEIISRGAIQSCFRDFFDGPYRASKAIFVSALIFQLVHAVRSFYFSVCGFFLGLFWGVLFEKQRSLVGVCISHYMIGFWSFYVLGFEQILDMIDIYECQQCIKNQIYILAK